MLRAVWHGKNSAKKRKQFLSQPSSAHNPKQQTFLLQTTANCVLYAPPRSNIHQQSMARYSLSLTFNRFSLICTSIFVWFFLFSPQHSVANHHVAETYFAYALCKQAVIASHCMKNALTTILQKYFIVAATPTIKKTMSGKFIYLFNIIIK